MTKAQTNGATATAAAGWAERVADRLAKVKDQKRAALQRLQALEAEVERARAQLNALSGAEAVLVELAGTEEVEL